MILIQSSLSQKKRDVVFPLLIFHHDCAKVEWIFDFISYEIVFCVHCRNDRVLFIKSRGVL